MTRDRWRLGGATGVNAAPPCGPSSTQHSTPQLYTMFHKKGGSTYASWLHGTVVERRSLAGKLSLTCS